MAKSDHVQRKLAQRQSGRTLDPLLDEQVASGRFIACISSRPGQVMAANLNWVFVERLSSVFLVGTSVI